MPSLTNQPTLSDFQRYVTQLEVERGFADQDVLQKCLLLGEEVGELFKAIRKASKMSLDKNSPSFEVDEELADVLIMLLAVANRFEVDLEQAFRLKEEKNGQRIWGR